MKISAPKPRNAILTIPNVITIFGFIFTGLYVWSFLSGMAVWIIFLFLFLAGMTDALDGFSARFLKQVTNLGEILDPVRDRVLMLAVFLNLAFMPGANRIFAIFIILVFEAGITAFNIGMDKKNRKKIYHFYGKSRQAGHLFFASLAILGASGADIVLLGMLACSLFAFHGAMIGKLAKKDYGRMV